MTIPYNKRKPAVNVQYNNIEGFIHTLNSTSPDTQLDINAGVCLDASNTFDINVGDYKGTSDNANAVTTLDATFIGLNGIDTGALEASKLYYLYAIASSPENEPAGFILSLDPEQPIMPYDYDLFRLVGVQATDSSADFEPMTVVGYSNSRRVVYNNPPGLVSSGSATTATSVALTNVAPSLSNGINVALRVGQVPNAAGDTVTLRVLGSTSDYFVGAAQVASFETTNYVEIPALLNGSDIPEFQYLLSDGSSTVDIDLLGFDLEL